MSNASDNLSLLLNLLALFLNEGGNAPIVARLIKKIPGVYRLRGKSPSKDIIKVARKYFFEPLKPEAKLVPLSKLNLDPKTIAQFVKTMRAIIAKIEKDDRLIESVSKVKSWLDEYQPAEPVENVEQRLIQQQADIDRLKHELNRKLDEINELHAELEQRDMKIAEQLDTINFLDREQNHKAAVAINKIASQLRIEYQELQTALEMEMDVDLGENMRIQLKNIFAILERNGVTFD